MLIKHQGQKNCKKYCGRDMIAYSEHQIILIELLNYKNKYWLSYLTVIFIKEKVC